MRKCLEDFFVIASLILATLTSAMPLYGGSGCSKSSVAPTRHRLDSARVISVRARLGQQQSLPYWPDPDKLHYEARVQAAYQTIKHATSTGRLMDHPEGTTLDPDLMDEGSIHSRPYRTTRELLAILDTFAAREQTELTPRAVTSSTTSS